MMAENQPLHLFAQRAFVDITFVKDSLDAVEALPARLNGRASDG